MKKRSRSASIIFALVAIAIMLAPSYFRVFEDFELATLDLRFSVRPQQPQHKDIAIIEIANDTLEKIGRWPIKRNWHAAMIDVLSACGAKIIIYDTLFTEESSEDALLIESTRKAGNVYYGFSFEAPKKRKTGIPETEEIDSFLISGLIKHSRGYGFINVIPDRDGKTRRAPLRIKYKDKIYPHLALLAAGEYLGKEVNEITAPLDEDSLTLINFAGKWEDSFMHYSFIDILKSYSLLAEGQTGTINLNELRNKVCFIGLTATGTHDLNPIPLEERYPGLGIHINLFNTIVTDNFLARPDRFVNLFILVVLSLLTVFVTLKTRPLISSIFIASTISLFIILSAALFIFLGIWIDVFYPIIALFLLYLAITFYKYVSEMQKRQLIEKELEVATKIQESFLPENPPEQNQIDIAAKMSPAKQVGGDLYDFVELQDGRTGIMIGDVSGKGVPAALYMARAVSLFRLFSKTSPDTKEAVTRLNDTLSDESKANLFVTLAYLIFDTRKNLLTFSSGGHLPTILLKKGEDVCRLLDVKKGMPLGLMSGEYDQESVSVSSGDIIILYTDGVSEAMSRRREEFGEERLTKAIIKNRELGSRGLLEALDSEISKFAKGAPQHDDITLIVAEIK
ncbi:MAG: CHASE2 domain-containing protein [Candidatus Omnitrophica bacterium]|nr:CHASE2 domain-containing protein [Candidatus Omnitrophota bacterium]